MSVSSLQILANHREALLLAEAMGWLHDYRKCSEEHLQTQSTTKKGQGIPRADLEKRQSSLRSVNLQFTGTLNALRNVIDLLNDEKWHEDVLGQYLSRCHNTAHLDKQEPSNGKQSYPGTQISSPVGFEIPVITGLTNSLWSLPWAALADIVVQRQILREKINTLFSVTVADSRRSINEVDLWNWGMLVGALYKSALAGVLLTGTPPAARDLRWRLLGIRFDGLNYLLNAMRIPDLLARQELLADGLNKVRELLEVTYPLGSEVYRDENGSVYVVPNVSDLLDRADDQGTSLRALILQAFSQGTVKGNVKLQIGKEIVPHLELENTPWWGQDPDWEAKTKLDKQTNRPKDPHLYGQKLNNELPSIAGFLKHNIVSPADPDWVKDFWQGGQVDEVCPVCGLRPQGPGRKAKERHVCDICEQRRADRSKIWATEQTDTTIWSDEVADANGRLALIVGQFGLDQWLDGTMVQTLTVDSPENGQANIKEPTFARLRRVWETTRRFWEEVTTAELPRCVPDVSLRLQITPKDGQKLSLSSFHAYDLVVKGVRVSVVWDGENFLTTDNLQYLEKPEQLGKPLEEILRSGTFKVEEPTGYGAKNKHVGQIKIEKVEQHEQAYTPVVPILAEPRTFMALVPADKAMDVIHAIRRKYETEMGKVRNRLPLVLGAVFFGRRTPLAAAIESGRRMLALQPQSQVWEVKSATKREDASAQDNHRKQTVELTLARDGREVNLSIPIYMGDGKTEDVWYPYWRVEAKPAGRTRWFVGPDGEHWVHASELRAGDCVQFTPSTFDFEYLDTTARRFEIFYQEGCRRDPQKRQRPYLLEELAAIEETWRAIRQLSKSQVYALDALIESKRQAWQKPIGLEAQSLPPADPFRQFVRDALRETGVYSAEMETAALRGILRDTLELYLEIMKHDLNNPSKEASHE